MTEQNLTKLVINTLTKAQYKALYDAGQISYTEIYLITDDGGSQYALADNVYSKSEIDNILANYTPSDLSNYYTKQELTQLLNGKADTSDLNDYVLETDLANVATSGNYNDLTNKPTIPDVSNFITREVTNLSNYYTKIQVDNNLSNYYTKTQVDNKTSSFITKNVNNLTNYYDKTTVDGKIPDVSSFITKAVNDLTNYYNKTDIDTKLSTIPKFSIKVVSALPTTDISDSTIYLVAKDTTETNNLYVEYIHTTNGWEKLGEQTINSVGTSVEANPTLTGNEDPLTSIKIGDTAYTLDGAEITFSENTKDGGTSLKSITINGVSWNIDGGTSTTPTTTTTPKTYFVNGMDEPNTNFYRYFADLFNYSMTLNNGEEVINIEEYANVSFTDIITNETINVTNLKGGDTLIIRHNHLQTSNFYITEVRDNSNNPGLLISFRYVNQSIPYYGTEAPSDITGIPTLYPGLIWLKPVAA